jgi:murein DD-endopeptidase MepM/ murein hydrolase activator NlpD
MVLAGCETIPEAKLASPPARYPVPPSQPLSSLSGSSYTVRPGDTLWRIARSYGLSVPQLAAANRMSGSSHLRVGQKLFLPLPAESQQFLWPVRGRIARAADGLQIVAPAGSLVRASRTGRVAVATRNLSGWGRTVILDHFDGYLTVYAGLEQILVAPGVDVRQGLPLGSVSSGALHFEIRYGSTPRNVSAFLPRE